MLPAIKRKKEGRTKGAFWRAVEAMKEYQKQAPVRIGFIIDATGSRHATWEQAQMVQAKMFAALKGGDAMALRLIHFGGDELTDHGWERDSGTIAAHMAQTRCVGGSTQIVPGLAEFRRDARDLMAQAIILVGDAFEENSDEAFALAHELKAKGCKVFSFLEGNDMSAQSVFQELAEITGGKFARFGDDLPLSDLCVGVALLAAGDKIAAGRIKNENVKHLLLGGPSIKGKET